MTKQETSCSATTTASQSSNNSPFNGNKKLLLGQDKIDCLFQKMTSSQAVAYYNSHMIIYFLWSNFQMFEMA